MADRCSHHIIVLTTGKQDRGAKATLALSWGCAALALGKSVSLFFTMEGTVWALAGAMKGVAVGGFEPLANYLDQYLDLGGEILVCSPCSDYYCSWSPEELPARLIPQAKLTGLTTIAAMCGPGTNIITF